MCFQLAAPSFFQLLAPASCIGSWPQRILFATSFISFPVVQLGTASSNLSSIRYPNGLYATPPLTPQSHTLTPANGDLHPHTCTAPQYQAKPSQPSQVKSAKPAKPSKTSQSQASPAKQSQASQAKPWLHRCKRCGEKLSSSPSPQVVNVGLLCVIMYF